MSRRYVLMYFNGVGEDDGNVSRTSTTFGEYCIHLEPSRIAFKPAKEVFEFGSTVWSMTRS